MKTVMITLLVLFVALLALTHPSVAQTPVVIGPATTLAWFMPGVPVSLAQGCSYSLSVGGGSFVPVVGAVTCTAPIAPATDPGCSVNLLAQTTIPIGAGSLTMTATCGGVTSLPSTPFAYLDVVVPIPAGLKIK